MTQEQQDKIKAIEEQMASLQKQLEEVRNSPKEVWEPSGEYTIQSNGSIDSRPNNGQRSFIGSYKTEEQAVKAKSQLRAFAHLLAYVAEFDADWEADWNDKYQKKYFVFFYTENNTWEYSYSYSYTCESIQVYMSEQCAKDLADKLNRGEVVL